MKQVEEATKGRVKIEVYPSQTLIKSVDMWKGIRSGIADIGWCVQGYWPEQTPLSDVMSLPFLPINSAEKGSEALWKLYEKFSSVQKEFSEIQPLVLYTSSPNLLVSKKQVRTLEDFKGLKARVLGGPPTEMAKALGAVPTLIPMPDVYQSLDKGVVDGAAAPWEAVQGFRLYEVAKNYTMAPFYVAYFSLCANKQKWQSLPKDVRDAIMSVSGLAGAKFWGKNFFDTAEQGVIERAKAGNYELNRYQVPPRRACTLDQARRRADLERVGQEDGRQGPQERPRHPQHRGRFAQELVPAGAHRKSHREAVTVLQSIDRWLRRCELVLVYTSVLAAVAMMCLTSADALSRYLFNRPIMGAYEITEKYLMVAAIFLGLSYAYRGGVFIRVTFLVDRLPARPKLLAQYLAHLMSLLFCLIILVATTQQAVRGLSDDTTLSALPLLVGPAYCLVPLGFLALTLIMLIDLRRIPDGRSYLFREEAPPA